MDSLQSIHIVDLFFLQCINYAPFRFNFSYLHSNADKSMNKLRNRTENSKFHCYECVSVPVRVSHLAPILLYITLNFSLL